MKKTVFFTILIIELLAGGTVFATDNPLERVAVKMRGYKSLKIDYTLSVKGEQSDTYGGEMWISGDRYHVTIGDRMTVFSDGKNQYAYNKNNKELVIEKLSAAGSLLDAPQHLLSLSEKDFRVVSSFRDESGRNILTLVPAGERYRKEVTSVVLTADAAWNVSVIRLKETSGMEITLSVTRLYPNVTIPESKFEYNPKQFQGIEIIDFR